MNQVNTVLTTAHFSYEPENSWLIKSNELKLNIRFSVKSLKMSHLVERSGYWMLVKPEVSSS